MATLNKILASFCIEDDDYDPVVKYNFGVTRKPIRKFGTLLSSLLEMDILIPSDEEASSVTSDEMYQIVDEEKLNVETTATFVHLRSIGGLIDFDFMKMIINKNSSTWPAVIPIMSFKAAKENRKDILEYIHELVWSSKFNKTKYLAFDLWTTYTRQLYDYYLHYHMIYDWFFEQPSIWTNVIYVVAHENGNTELANWLEEIGFIES